MTVRSRPAAAPPILLVEDKDSLRTMLRLALEAQGQVVVEARDYAEAVAALQTTHPAIVLSDLRLPDGDGLGVLRAAKEIDPELPVVVMPGGEHFCHRKLHILKRVIVDAWR